jgi:hypothetical protein
MSGHLRDPSRPPNRHRLPCAAPAPGRQPHHRLLVSGVSDVVAEDHLTVADRAERGSYVGCIAGADPPLVAETTRQRAGTPALSASFSQAADLMTQAATHLIDDDLADGKLA